jgi:hypothetical protein
VTRPVEIAAAARFHGGGLLSLGPGNRGIRARVPLGEVSPAAAFKISKSTVRVTSSARVGSPGRARGRAPPQVAGCFPGITPQAFNQFCSVTMPTVDTFLPGLLRGGGDPERYEDRGEQEGGRVDEQDVGRPDNGD